MKYQIIINKTFFISLLIYFFLSCSENFSNIKKPYNEYSYSWNGKIISFEIVKEGAEKSGDNISKWCLENNVLILEKRFDNPNFPNGYFSTIQDIKEKSSVSMNNSYRIVPEELKALRRICRDKSGTMHGCSDISNRWINEFVKDIYSARQKYREVVSVEMRAIRNFDKVRPKLTRRSMNKKNIFDHTNGISFGFNSDEKIIIYINKDYWDKASYNQKKILIYHELGHDLLNLNHVSDKCHFMYHIVDESVYQCQYENLKNDIRNL